MRKRIDALLEQVLIGLMSLLIIDVLWQVASRYLFASPSSFTDEVAGYLLIWVGLLGASYVAGKNQHLAIDLLLQKSNAKGRFFLEIVIYCMVALFALTVLVIGGGNLVYTRFLLHVTSASLELNLGYVYAVLPVSGLLTLYYSLDTLRKLLKNRKS